MKRFKGALTIIMSMVLVIAMVGTGCVFANNGDADSFELVFVDQNASIISDGEGTSLVTKDLENGDVVFKLYYFDVLIDSGYLDRSEGVLYETVYDENGNARTSAIEMPGAAAIDPVIIQQNRDYTSGSINYDLYDSGNYFVGTTKINVYGSEGSTVSSSYNLNGTYQSLVTFASAIVSIISMGITGTSASTIATYLLNALGIALNSSWFQISTNSVPCTTYTVNWSGTEQGTGYTGSMVSKKYKCTMPGGTIKYVYQYWYTLSDFRNHSVGHAVAIFNTVLNVYNPNPTSWTVTH